MFEHNELMPSIYVAIPMQNQLEIKLNAASLQLHIASYQDIASLGHVIFGYVEPKLWSLQCPQKELCIIYITTAKYFTNLSTAFYINIWEIPSSYHEL